MNRRQADEIVEYISAMWDGWTPPVELAQLVADVFALEWLTVERARKIVAEVRLESHFARPTPADFHKAIAAENRKRLAAKQAAEKAEKVVEVAGNRTLSEWKAWYASDPAGKAEWAALPGSKRRGLRVLFGITDGESGKQRTA